MSVDHWLNKCTCSSNVEYFPLFSCLRLRQWPVTYLITLSDWTMSCQPGPPRAHYGQWPRWQQRPAGGTFPYKMANFHGVYLIFGRIDSTEFFIWYCENCLSYCHKISNWYNDPVLCYHRVKYAILQWADKGAAIISLFSPPCASATYGNARMRRRKNRHNNLGPAWSLDLSWHMTGADLTNCNWIV